MNKVETALNRFDSALQGLEQAVNDLAQAERERPAEGGVDAAAVQEELAALREDRLRLETDLGTMRAEAAMLEALTDRLGDKLDVAIADIRDILEN